MKHMTKRVMSFICITAMLNCVGALSIAELPDAEVSILTASAAASKADEFVGSATDLVFTSVHNGSSGQKQFSMNGRDFYQGAVFESTWKNSEICFDVSSVNSLSFTIGHVDNTAGANATLRVYLDGQEYDSIPLHWTMNLQQYDLNVSAATSLKIVLDRSSNDSSYAIADFTVENSKTNNQNEVPEYDSADAFMRSGFGTAYMSVSNTAAKEPAYYMNGRGFYEGVVFNDDWHYGRVCYNVENVSSLSFTIGHVDNTSGNTATLKIYLDDKEYDTVDLHWTMNLQKYELDVSGASVLRIELDHNSNNSSYALGDFCVDAYKQSKDHTIPEYNSSDGFMCSGFGTAYMSVSNTAAKELAYYMNGRGFYEGVVFNDDWHYGRVCYNVENVSSLSFTIGHVDNTSGNTATLKIYLDDKEYDTVDLHWTMNLQKYELDVSGANVLRIELDHNSNNSSYALGDFCVDAYKQTKEHTIPDYDSSDAFMRGGFAAAYSSISNTAAKEPSYYMNGRGFYEGVIFNDDWHYGRICYNVENVDRLSFTIGHVDNTSGNNATLKFYLDDKLYDSVDLHWTMNLQKYELDVSGASVLRIELDHNSNNSSYALADFKVDSYTQTKEHVVPAFENAEDFLNSGFAVQNMTLANTASKEPVFYFGEKGYYQGMMFTNEWHDGRACYNVESLDSVSFTMGHIDGAKDANAKLLVYMDDVQTESIEMTAGMAPVRHTLDVSKASVLRLVLARSSKDSGYALADVAVSVKNVDVPEDPTPEVPVDTHTPGDVNDDGAVNLKDVVLLSRYIAGGMGVTVNEAAADVNGDNLINLKDVVLIRRYIVGGWGVTLQ